jgi:hypothetical protein
VTDSVTILNIKGSGLEIPISDESDSKSLNDIGVVEIAVTVLYVDTVVCLAFCSFLSSFTCRLSLRLLVLSVLLLLLHLLSLLSLLILVPRLAHQLFHFGQLIARSRRWSVLCRCGWGDESGVVADWARPRRCSRVRSKENFNRQLADAYWQQQSD